MVRVENLSEAQHRSTIREEGKLYSATGNGKIPWVSAEDIAAVAYRALVDEKSHDCEHVVLGSELLSYGQVRCPSHLPRLSIPTDLQSIYIARRDSDRGPW